ncbi:MAG TPA: copper chaperone [Candidatus Thioglobus sp.]|jgi:copper chaperone CopZ|nr:copper chaperone [Candidatus Thioglobus sp.]HIL41965.1 copper chaperone [Gammaproteobacteria bacterium]
MEIAVENIKCGGCAGSITKKLSSVFGTDNIKIDVGSGTVNIDVNEDQKEHLSRVLQDLGYPQINSVSGLNSAKARAKSFVSCAIGKLDK